MVLLAAAVGAVVFWDIVILPLYAGIHLHVTFVPLLVLGLCATVLFWLFARIKKNTRDPVRRSPAGSMMGLAGFIVLNLGALLLFGQGWSFISEEARWAGIALIMVNVNGAWLLFYLFGMRWNRTPGARRRIHDAVVQSLRRAEVWHEPPPYLQRKEASGWRHSSSVYAHAVYFEFARAYEAALEHLQHHLTRLQIDQWGRQHAETTMPDPDALPRALATPLEPCLKAGNALVFYLGFFDDVNGHRGWMAQEIAWRMVNVKLLHVAACLAALPEAANPSDTLHADIADLKRLYRLYQRKRIAETGDATGKSPLQTLPGHLGPWRAAALQNRLCRLFLTGLYHNRHHDENLERWAALWQRPLGYAAPNETEVPAPKPPAGLPVFFDEVAPVWIRARALRAQGVRFEAWQAEHFFRHLAMQAGLPGPLPFFLDALAALVRASPAPEEDPAPLARIAVPGFDAGGLDDDLTNLLMALPQLDAEDIHETDFQTLWTNATVLWMLEDLVFFERTLSSVQFKDVLQDRLWERAHPQIRTLARRLMQTPRSRQRWRENQTLLARKTNDPNLTLRQTWERVPLAS